LGFQRIIRAIIFRFLRCIGFSIEESCVAQYIYTMNRVSKMVPPKREILKDISLSFFPGAKIGVLGLNGAGKSTCSVLWRA
jgi:ABC-type polysaccharide/polyol phosphate transport system ATPase subunit